MIEPPDTVHTGTLGSCIRKFMSGPENERPLYEIFTEAQAALSKTILLPPDIIEIASRDDFPKE